MRREATVFCAAGNIISWSAVDATSISSWRDLVHELVVDATCRDVELFAFVRKVNPSFPPELADLHVWFFNPDATQEDVCGNAIRCLPEFLGVEDGQIRTQHGRAIRFAGGRGWGAYAVHVADILFGRLSEHPSAVLVDPGTPHVVLRVDAPDLNGVAQLGKQISTGNSPRNATFFRQLEADAVQARVFERGVGETRSCGTAATSIAATLLQAGNGNSLDVRFVSGQVLHVQRTDDLLTVSGNIQRLR